MNILITGASRGVGKALSKELAKRPCRMFLAARSEEKLLNLKKELSTEACEIETFYLDLEDETSVNKAIEIVKDSFTQLDMLINCAGISQRSLAIETEHSVLKKIMQINFIGTVQLSQGLYDLLLKSPSPSIIVLSSVVGHYGFPLRSAYAASKHALQGYFESLQVENEKLKVSIVSPGRINTDISLHALDSRGKNHGKRDKNLKNGMAPETAAKRILKRARKGRKLIFLGTGPVVLIYIKRFFPMLYYAIARNSSLH